MTVIEHVDPNAGHTRDATSHAPIDPSREAFYAVVMHPDFPALLDALARRSTLDAESIYRTVNGLRALVAWRARAVFDGQGSVEAVNAASAEQLAAATRLYPVAWGMHEIQAEEIQRAKDAIDLFRQAVGFEPVAAELVAGIMDRPPSTPDEAIVWSVAMLANPKPAGDQLISVFPEHGTEEEHGEACCAACAATGGSCATEVPDALDTGHPDVTSVAEILTNAVAADPWLLILKGAPRRRSPCSTGACPTS